MQYEPVVETDIDRAASVSVLPAAVIDAAAEASPSLPEHAVDKDVGREGPAAVLQAEMDAAVAAANDAVSLADAMCDHIRSLPGMDVGSGSAGKRNRVLYELDYRSKVDHPDEAWPGLACGMPSDWAS